MSKTQDEKLSRLEPLYFLLSCFAIALLIFGLRFIDIYFEGVIRQRYTNYVDWLWAVLIAGFFGAFMIGGLLLAFPLAALEKSKLVRRAKKILGL